MRLAITALAAGLALAAGGAQAASVEIKDAVARVTVVPEDRGDIKVEITSAHRDLPLSVRTFGDRAIVDGNLDRRIRGCLSGGGVRVSRLGTVAWADMPRVVIHTPRDVKVRASGAVFGSAGRSASFDLANAGCGDWTVANVEGELTISQAGSGTTRAGTSGAAKLRIAGSGDTTAGAVRGGLDVNVAGSGDVRVASVSGPLDIHVAGSGNVTVAEGRATRMTVAVAGSGDVEFGGSADSLKARVAGSGDIRAKAVTGEISKAVVGSGNIIIG
jgi:Putative auto-transporter adhesin, head GIN domain